MSLEVVGPAENHDVPGPVVGGVVVDVMAFKALGGPAGFAAASREAPLRAAAARVGCHEPNEAT